MRSPLRAATAPVAQRRIEQPSTDEPGPVPASDTSGVYADAGAPVDADGGSVQRAFDAAGEFTPVGSHAPGRPLISRQAADGASVEGGSAGGDSGTAGGPAAGSEKELDDLARKLFPRLQLRFRNELLVDRERVGALIDFGR
jgi:hypothetical protein